MGISGAEPYRHLDVQLGLRRDGQVGEFGRCDFGHGVIVTAPPRIH